MKKIRYIIEYPYRKFCKWKLDRDDSRRIVLREFDVSKKININICDLILFYLVFLCIVILSLAVFIGVYLIFKDIFT